MLRTTHPPLSALINCLWYSEGSPETHSRERRLPNGEPAIIFNLREKPIRIYDAADFTKFASYGHAALSSARSNCIVMDTEQQERVVGIQFRPGGAFSFFRMPASETENLSVALSDLWPGRTSAIHKQMTASANATSIFQKRECFLLEQLVRAPELHPAVAFAIKEFGRFAHTGSVTSVTEQIGFRSRRFIEVFTPEVASRQKPFTACRDFRRRLGDDLPDQYDQLGADCARVRILRSAAFHPRFTIVLRHDSNCLCRRGNAASQPRASRPISRAMRVKFLTILKATVCARIGTESEDSMSKVKAIPDGYHSVQPYIILRDCAAAIAFYNHAFGAKEKLRMPSKEGRIMHAEVEIGDSIVMLADEAPQMEAFSVEHFGGSPVSLMIYTEDCDGMYSQALAAGAQSLREPTDQLYGDRMAGVQDPFGYKWWIATHVKDKPPQEMAAS